MRTLICGINVNESVGSEPLVGSQTERRLLHLTDLCGSLADYEFFRLQNLWNDPLLPTLSVLTYVARMTVERCPDDTDRIVFLGTAGREAIGGKWLTWYPATTKDGRLVSVAACPHPSGRNRWWNTHDNVMKARAFWQDLMKEYE